MLIILISLKINKGDGIFWYLYTLQSHNLKKENIKSIWYKNNSKQPSPPSGNMNSQEVNEKRPSHQKFYIIKIKKASK